MNTQMAASSPPSTAQSDIMDELMTDLSSNASQHQHEPLAGGSNAAACSSGTQPLPFPVHGHPTRAKRPSSSLSSSQFATSPLEGTSMRAPGSSTSSFPAGTSYNLQEEEVDGDTAEPPSKKSASLDTTSSTLMSNGNSSSQQPAKRMALILDVEDVQSSGAELASSILLPQQRPSDLATHNAGGLSPSSSHSSQSNSTSATNSDLSRSLLAGVCSSYSPHFVLSGVDLRDAEYADVFNAIYDDVKHPSGEHCEPAVSPSSSTSSTLASAASGAPSFQQPGPDQSGLPPRPSRLGAHRRQNSSFGPADSPRSRASQKSCFEGEPFHVPYLELSMQLSLLIGFPSCLGFLWMPFCAFRANLGRGGGGRPDGQHGARGQRSELSRGRPAGGVAQRGGGSHARVLPPAVQHQGQLHVPDFLPGGQAERAAVQEQHAGEVGHLWRIR